MRILLTARGPKLADIIAQLARDLGEKHEVAVLAQFPLTMRHLRDAGIRTYSLATLIAAGKDKLAALGRELLASPPPDVNYLDIPVLEFESFDSIRAKIEGHPDNPGYFVGKGIAAIAAAQAVLSHFRPHMVAVWNGRIPEARIFLELAQRAGAATCCLERGLLPDSLVIDPKGVNGDSYLCTDEWNSIAAGSPTEADLKATTERLNLMCHGGHSIVKQPDAQSADDIRQKLGLPPDAAMVLVPAQIDWDTNIVYHSPNFKTNADVLQATIDALAARPDAYVVFKPHPEEPADHDYGAILGDRGRIATGMNLHSLIEASELVIVRNSTAGLEAIAHHKPVMILGRSIYSHKGFTYDAANRDEVAGVMDRARQNGFTAEMHSLAERFFVHIARDYLYFADGREIIPGSNAPRLDALCEAVGQREPEYPASCMLLDAIPAAQARITQACDSADEAEESIARMRASEPGHLLIVKACDRNRFTPALRAIVGSGLANTYTVLANDPKDPERITSLGGVRKLAVSAPAVAWQLLRARAGRFDGVIIISNQSDALSPKTRLLSRFLGRDKSIVLEYGMADVVARKP